MRESFNITIKFDADASIIEMMFGRRCKPTSIQRLINGSIVEILPLKRVRLASGVSSYVATPPTNLEVRYNSNGDLILIDSRNRRDLPYTAIEVGE